VESVLVRRDDAMTKRLILISLIFLTAACAPSLPSNQPVLDAEAVEQAATEVIEVTFYGESCDVSAPEVLPVGEYSFVLKDLDGKTSAELYVARLTDGHTYQDLLEPQDSPGDYYPKPNWLIYATNIRTVNASTGERSYEVTLESGEHAIYIGNRLPTNKWGLWFCVPLMVVELPLG
jgi:hypothetical protein